MCLQQCPTLWIVERYTIPPSLLLLERLSSFSYTNENHNVSLTFYFTFILWTLHEMCSSVQKRKKEHLPSPDMSHINNTHNMEWAVSSTSKFYTFIPPHLLNIITVLTLSHGRKYYGVGLSLCTLKTVFPHAVLQRLCPKFLPWLSQLLVHKLSTPRLPYMMKTKPERPLFIFNRAAMYLLYTVKSGSICTYAELATCKVIWVLSLELPDGVTSSKRPHKSQVGS